MALHLQARHTRTRTCCAPVPNQLPSASGVTGITSGAYSPHVPRVTVAGELALLAPLQEQAQDDVVSAPGPSVSRRVNQDPHLGLSSCKPRPALAWLALLALLAAPACNRG